MLTFPANMSLIPVKKECLVRTKQNPFCIIYKEITGSDQSGVN